jgi:hypothetical protein
MTKLIANLLIIAGVCVGAVSATTAYRWSLDLPDEAFTLSGVGVQAPKADPLPGEDAEPGSDADASSQAASDTDVPAGAEVDSRIDIEPVTDDPAADSAAEPTDDSEASGAIIPGADEPAASETDVSADVSEGAFGADSIEYVQLKANAGQSPDDPTEPLAKASTLKDPTPLTPELLAELRAAGVEAVHVKTFHLGYWEHRWLFLASAIAITIGGLTVRIVSRPQLNAVDSQGRAVVAVQPIEHLRNVESALDTLTAGLRGLSTDNARCRAIMDELGDIMQTTVVEFVDARELLIAKLGLSGFARVMDSFAGTERMLNRAWSAASDAHEPEATRCLAEGREMLAETVAMLKSMS